MPTAIDHRIFVVGVPRSGTTLVQSLLAAHSHLTSFTESHLFSRYFSTLPILRIPILTRDPSPRLREFLAENGASDNVTSDSLTTDSMATDLRRSRFRRALQTRPVARRILWTFDELARRRGASGWIEKTPRHLRAIQVIENAVGDTSRPRFVHVIRRGLETVASLREASRKWERSYDLATCVRRWNTDVATSVRRLAASPLDACVIYEQLTTEPEPTLRRLLADLGLAWEPELLERYASASESLITQDETWKKNVGREIQPSTTSDRLLSSEERAWATRALRNDLYTALLRRANENLREDP